MERDYMKALAHKFAVAEQQSPLNALYFARNVQRIARQKIRQLQELEQNATEECKIPFCEALPEESDTLQKHLEDYRTISRYAQQKEVRLLSQTGTDEYLTFLKELRKTRNYFRRVVNITGTKSYYDPSNPVGNVLGKVCNGAISIAIRFKPRQKPKTPLTPTETFLREQQKRVDQTQKTLQQIAEETRRIARKLR